MASDLHSITLDTTIHMAITSTFYTTLHKTVITTINDALDIGQTITNNTTLYTTISNAPRLTTDISTRLTLARPTRLTLKVSQRRMPRCTTPHTDSLTTARPAGPAIQQTVRLAYGHFAPPTGNPSDDAAAGQALHRLSAHSACQPTHRTYSQLARRACVRTPRHLGAPTNRRALSQSASATHGHICTLRYGQPDRSPHLRLARRAS